MPNISVIVPVYNTREFIGECIRSVAAQSYDDFEVVVVNDGSTDGSLEEAKAAAAGDARFKFVTRENGGLSAARNTGLAHAEGEYVTFLDSDDKYVAHALSRMADAAARNDADLVDFASRTFYDTDRARSLHEEDNSLRDDVEGVLTGAELFACYVQRGQYLASACYHLIRRSVLTDNGLEFGEGLVHEDELFTPQLYAYAQRAVFLREDLYLRRVREGSIMTSKRGVRNVRALFRITQILRAWLYEHAQDYPEEFVDAFASNTALLCDAAFRDFRALDDVTASAFLASLDAADRADFDLTIRYAPAPADFRFHDVADSRAYRWVRRALCLVGR